MSPDVQTVPTPQRSLRELVRPLLLGRRVRILLLSGTALVSAMSEAVVLVAITQIAFSLAEGTEHADAGIGPIPIGRQVTATVDLGIAHISI